MQYASANRNNFRGFPPLSEKSINISKSRNFGKVAERSKAHGSG